MSKLFVCILMLNSIAWSAQVKTSTDLKNSSFCRDFKCALSSPFTDENGETTITYRLEKDPTNLQLYVVITTAEKIKNMTFKFIGEDAVVDKKILTNLFNSVLGKNVDGSELDKLAAASENKIKRADLATIARLKVGNLSVATGRVLKKPTYLIEIP